MHMFFLREEFDDGYANPVDEANDAVAIAWPKHKRKQGIANLSLVIHGNTL